MRIGILGGTFNPVHIGHLIIAEEVREKLGLERVLFMPTSIPPHKSGSDVAEPSDRFAMIKLAIKGNKYFEVSDLEIKRGGFSYTIDTVRALKDTYPDDELFFITGSDLLTYLDEWKDFTEIRTMVTFVVATRPGYPLEKIPSYIKTVSIRAVDVSAFQVRACIAQGRSFRYLVPEAVYTYIQKRKLYR